MDRRTEGREVGEGVVNGVRPADVPRPLGALIPRPRAKSVREGRREGGRGPDPVAGDVGLTSRVHPCGSVG